MNCLLTLVIIALLGMIQAKRKRLRRPARSSAFSSNNNSSSLSNWQIYHHERRCGCRHVSSTSSSTRDWTPTARSRTLRRGKHKKTHISARFRLPDKLDRRALLDAGKSMDQRPRSIRKKIIQGDPLKNTVLFSPSFDGMLKQAALNRQIRRAHKAK